MRMKLSEARKKFSHLSYHSFYEMANNEMPTICNFQGDRIPREEFHTSFFV